MTDDDVAVAASSQQTNSPMTSLHNSSKAPARAAADTCLLFPFRLHKMLDAAEDQGFTSVVSWLPNEVSFKVHDKETFVSLIMGQYFEQHHYKSFQRQLNMWGFTRYTTKGPEAGGYTHQYLMRGKPSLCSRMVRSKKPKKTVTATATSRVQKMKAPAATPSLSSSKGNQCKKNKKVSPLTTTTTSTSTVLEASLQTTTLSRASSVVSIGDSETSHQQDLDSSIGSSRHSDQREESMIIGQWEASLPSSSTTKTTPFHGRPINVIQFFQQKVQQEGVHMGNNYYSPYASTSLSATVEFEGRQFFPLVEVENDFADFADFADIW